MKKFLLIVLSVCTISFIGCSKEGPAGKDGINGINGKDGTNGVDGKDGKDGTIVYSGQGVPAASIGKVGDYYIDLQNVRLYGPKATSGWVTAFSMKGADGKDGINGINGKDGKDGTNGKNGTPLLSGFGSPSVTLGEVGDYYLDKNSYFLYGPKTATGWGAGYGLKGKDADVRTYMFSDPWNYYYTEQPQSGFFRFFFSGSFYINSFEAEHGLILGFIETTYGTVSYWSQAGTTHSNYLGVNFNSSFQLAKSNGTMTGAFIKVGKSLLSNTNSTDWTSMEDVKSSTGISRIKIVVIPYSTLSVLGYNKNNLNDKTIQIIQQKYLQ